MFVFWFGVVDYGLGVILRVVGFEGTMLLGFCWVVLEVPKFVYIVW